MPLTRIQNTAIGNDGITTAKLDDTTGGFTMPGQQFIKVPVGTTAQRPSSPAAGHLRFNTTLGTLEQYNTNTSSWAAIDSPPVITTLAYSGSKTAAAPAGSETITLTGTNFKSGLVVRIGGTNASSVSVASTTSLTFTTPAKAAGDYDITVTNPNGLTATLTNGISYNGTPAFSTAAGNLGSLASGEAMSTITIVAAEPDGGTLAYSVTSGTLPGGVSLGSANGQLTGTPTSVASTTTYNFDITATDDESQTNARSFNLIVVRPIYATTIAKSVRMENSASHYLYKSAGGSDGNRTTWTWSGWVKRTNLGQFAILGGGADSSNRDVLRFTSTDTLQYQVLNGGTALSVSTAAVWRDLAAWMHIVLRVDTTQSNSANRIKIYVNGQQQTLTGNTSNWHAQNSVTHFTSNDLKLLGARTGNGSSADLPFSGYIAHTHLIDGTSLAPTSFADSFYGVWTPKNYNTSDGAYGTQGFFFDFADANAIGDDESGSSNDWAVNALASHDILLDTPTSNFAIMSDIAQETTSHQSSEGGLAVPGPNNEAMGSTIGVNSGKWYWEMRSAAANGGDICPYIGVTDNPFIRDPDAHGGLNVNGTSYANFGSSSTFSNFTANSSGNGSTNSSAAESGIFGFALDLTAGTLKYYYNGSLKHTDSTIPTDGRHIHPYHATTNSGGAGWNTSIFNFGQNGTFNGTETAGGNADANSIGDFKYAPPSGHHALTTKNFGAYAVNIASDDRPEDYFDTVLFQAATSNGTHNHGSLTFQSDFTWIKNRNDGESHYLIDSVRGNQSMTDKFLNTNNYNQQGASGVSGTTFTQTATGYRFVESSISSGAVSYTHLTLPTN